ncbi:MAG: DUF5686 and carboxypeptidase regulatory-like domain-containing protein [Bacteroidales bacterium]|nr:DUF5686 and carboxypeptidase regulatory-like domain-containing protein [Bacteroidales bacterium]
MPVKAHSNVKTNVEGIVVNSMTGEGVPFAHVVLRHSDSYVGTTTDFSGRFSLETYEALDTLVVSCMGYETYHTNIILGEKNNIAIKLTETVITLDAVTITSKRERYTKKGNEANELIEQAIAQKSQNRLENLAYYQYKQYDNLEIAISNLGDSIENSKLMKRYNFMAENIDTAALTGKRILPFYKTETVAETFYRKKPESKKTFIDGYKYVEFTKFLSAESMDIIMRDIFGEINIYEDNIFFMQNQFMSPLSPLAPNFYKFYITDTVSIEGTDCIQILYAPRNSSDFGFMGYLYLTSENQQYAVRRTEIQLTKNTPVNFIKEILIKQDYELVQGIWTMTESITMVDFALAGENFVPLYGQKEITYSDFVFNLPQDDKYYLGSALIVRTEGYDERNDEYWEENRTKATGSTRSTYDFIEKLEDVKVYRVVRDFITTIVGGYYAAGPIDIGPVENMLSFNSIEGARFRIGGKTNGRMSRRFFIEAFGAYGLRDNEFKYNFTGHYSFNKKKNHPWEFPTNLLSISYEKNTDIPGQSFLYGTGDRLLISIGRGKTERMTMDRRFKINYKMETINYFSMNVNFTHLQQYPLGQLSFATYDGNDFSPYTITSFGLNLRYAPNEKFIQSQQNRYPINLTAPVFDLGYQVGIGGFLGGDYTFHKITAKFQKRWYISSYGYFDTYVDAGKILNQVPYPSLFIHHANQSWAFQDEAYNSMRYFEFVSDQYINLQVTYCMNGFILNRIPLIKKLNWRGLISFKALFGSVSDKNMPDPDTNPGLMIFPHDADGNPTTFTLNGKPFLEGNIGIENIFKILRIDLVKRFNYLDNPNISEWSLRFRLRLVF